MPRGLPDYYNPDTLVSQRLANVEEVVTQLRGIGGVDNRGQTLFSDTFGEGLDAWLATYGGDATYPVVSTTQTLIPPASVYFDAGTSGGDGYSYILKRFHLGESVRLGLETHIYYNLVSPLYRLHMAYNLSGDEYYAQLEVLPASGVLRVLAVSGWVTIGNVGYAGYAGVVWLPLKLVVDFESGYYVRALAGQKQFDISDHPLRSSAILQGGMAQFENRCIAANAGTNDAFIGFTSITVDEP